MLNCVIIEDELLDITLLSAYVNEAPNLRLQKTFMNPLEGIQYLSQESTDLLLLDEEMPDISGIQLAKSLATPPPVIMVTSHLNIAAEAYEIDAVDFLSKPITFERFLKGISKVYRRLQLQAHHTGSESSAPDSKITIKSGWEQHRVSPADILYLEAKGNQVVVHIRDSSPITSHMTLGKMMDLLPGNSFFRVHRSFAVNKWAVKKIERHQLLLSKAKVPVGRSYLPVVQQKFA
ncbi:LytR/AlgR family response regulator transcription factor [Roseivirga sp. BDSF3-8]|uniref:LytR/AlgR family response regulator transcription factor n=1 Tax=Roseivirga sp. BDSF3-8 TaxID=3241598 RepID=UPI0035323510